MENRYQYIKIQGEEKRYFCLQQNPFTLAWLLFFKKNTLLPLTTRKTFRKWSRQWIKDEIWNFYYFYRINFSKLSSFISCKFGSKKIDAIVELPFYGQVCVLVNKGYKILDLYRGVAIKIYREDVDIPSVAAELERLKKGNLFDFAPSIKRWDINERWYEEDYISGSLDRSDEAQETSVMLNKFSKDIIPCLGKLISRQSPIIVNSVDYVVKLKKAMEDISFWRRGVDGKKMRRILDFIHSMVERVEVNTPVYLVLAHGDFCSANMLNTKKGLRVIDWESAAYRSALFDFYSYLFFRPLHQKLPLDKLIPEIREALRLYIFKLDSIDPDISKNVKDQWKIYRLLFYIERIFMLVEREKYDTKLNIMDHMLRFIGVFNYYEELTASHPEILSCSNV